MQQDAHTGRLGTVRFALFLLGASILALVPTYAEDITIWKGQYYTGDTFNEGTYEMNFTVYDNKTGGATCFSNVTDVTTGSFGEWEVEQWGVNAACNDPTKTYWLSLVIDGEEQSPRKKITVGEYMRKDTGGTIDASFVFTEPQVFNSNITTTFQEAEDLLVRNSLLVVSNVNSHFSGLAIQNQNSSGFAASTLYVANDDSDLVTLAVTSSSYALLPPRAGGLFYDGNSTFLFANSNASQWWRWITFHLDGGGFHERDVMMLSTSGTLYLPLGGINLYGNPLSNASTVNATTVQANSVAASSVSTTSLTATTVTTTHTVTTALNATTGNVTTLRSGTVNATTVSASTVNSGAYTADGLTGITNNTLIVCGGVSLGLCNNPCTLTIRDGLIVGCT